MLELKDDALIGRGLHRECYRHPERSDQCVKIIVNGDSDENRREADYLAFLEARGSSLAGLSRCHGTVATDRGEGAVFDLISDFDGNVARTLAHYLDDHAFCHAHATALKTALSDLYQYLLANAIITMTIKPKNIVYQRLDETRGKLVIIDNIGNSDYLPIANHVTQLARAKISRKWSRFVASLRAQYADNPALGVILGD